MIRCVVGLKEIIILSLGDVFYLERRRGGLRPGDG